MLNLIASLIALIHGYIFVMESITWKSAKTRKVFGMSEADAETCRLLAFNQGFYNLFLSLAIATGFILQWRGLHEGRVLVDYAVISVFGAGVVLFSSGPKLLRPALIQSFPAFIYLCLRALL